MSMPPETEDGQHSDEQAAAPVALTQADEAGAKLAETDAVAFRAEGPRTDAKLALLLSLVVGGFGAVGVLSTVGTAASREAGSDTAAVLLTIAAGLTLVGLMMLVLVVMPKLRIGRRRQAGALAVVAALPDREAARAYYAKSGEDPLGYHAGNAWDHARIVYRRYRYIQVACVVVLVGLMLGAVGGLVLGWSR